MVSFKPVLYIRVKIKAEFLRLVRVRLAYPVEDALGYADDVGDPGLLLHLLDRGGQFVDRVGLLGGSEPFPLLTTGDGLVDLGYLPVEVAPPVSG